MLQLTINITETCKQTSKKVNSISVYICYHPKLPSLDLKIAACNAKCYRGITARCTHMP